MRRQVGFTIVELIVYITLSVMVMGVIGTVFMTGINLRSLIFAERGLTENSRLVEWVILDRLQEATMIISPASGTGTQLSIDSPTPSESPVVFQVTNGILTMTLGSQAAVPLTSDQIQVTHFSVTQLSGTPAAVRLSFTYQANTSSGASPTYNSLFTYTFRYE